MCGFNPGWYKQQNSTLSHHPGNAAWLMGEEEEGLSGWVCRKLGAIFNIFVTDLIMQVGYLFVKLLTSKTVLVSNNPRRCETFQMVSMTQGECETCPGPVYAQETTMPPPTQPQGYFAAPHPLGCPELPLNLSSYPPDPYTCPLVCVQWRSTFRQPGVWLLESVSPD